MSGALMASLVAALLVVWVVVLTFALRYAVRRAERLSDVAAVALGSSLYVLDTSPETLRPTDLEVIGHAQTLRSDGLAGDLRDRAERVAETLRTGRRYDEGAGKRVCVKCRASPLRHKGQMYCSVCEHKVAHARR